MEGLMSEQAMAELIKIRFAFTGFHALQNVIIDQINFNTSQRVAYIGVGGGGLQLDVIFSSGNQDAHG